MTCIHTIIEWIDFETSISYGGKRELVAPQKVDKIEIFGKSHFPSCQEFPETVNLGHSGHRTSYDGLSCCLHTQVMAEVTVIFTARG